MLFRSTEDTNLLHRGGREGLDFVRQKAAEIEGKAETEKELLSQMADLDKLLIRRNLSPGGCADLLAAALFVRFISER